MTSNPLATQMRPSFRATLNPVLTLGWPIVLTELCIMGTGFIDSAMAGRYSSLDLAGVSLGNSILWPCYLLFTGVTVAFTPITAQLRGAGKIYEVGPQIQQGLWLTLVATVLLVLLVRNLQPALLSTGIDPTVAVLASDYLHAASWGLPALVIYAALRRTSEGLGETRPPMLIAASILPLNAVLNYVLIYGKFGFPEMGGVGCGWATACVFWVELGLMTLFLRRPYFLDTQLFSRLMRPHWPTMLKILRLGMPIGIAIFLEMAMFSVMSIFVARLGITDVASHSIAFNLNWMTYVIPMGLGSAAGIRIGYLVGKEDYAAARQTAAAMFRFAICYALIVSALLVTFRFNLVQIYTTDPEVMAVAATLLLFIAFYQITDDTQAVFAGSLRGYKDTTTPMIFSLLGYWGLALPLGHSLAMGWLLWEPLGVYGYWTGMTIGMSVVTVCVGLRLRSVSGNVAKIRALSNQRAPDNESLA